MKRGEIWFADLNPTRGSEIAKCRPVLIVSNDANNRAASTITILPLTSNVAKVYPFEVLLTAAESGLPKDSKIQAQQIRTITKERITGNAVGSVSKPTLQLVDAAIRLHLGV
ncbi:MAG: type II toxin-antitoxin system PemK/MazF family toxin [Gallionella sp.]|nr:type II toxin-antitoxin system PemK/MazF family toxin [Gallionella sp.]MDD4957891.1 type II toxin-antitoxin system PemK/MazF family toxin [Gallionella sp.]